MDGSKESADTLRKVGRVAGAAGKAALKHGARSLATFLGVTGGVALLIIVIVLIVLLGIYGAMPTSANPHRAEYEAAAKSHSPPVVSQGGLERNHELDWGLLYAVDLYSSLLTDKTEDTPDATAAALAPRFTYRGSETVTTGVKDRKPYSVTDHVKLLVRADTYRGVYRYSYKRVTETFQGGTVTHDVQDGVQYEKDWTRLENLLRSRLGGEVSPELPVMVVEAAQGFTSGQPNLAWLESEPDAWIGSALGFDWTSKYQGDGLPTLVWPTEGNITDPFGPRIHPLLGYESNHTGVDIAAPYGAPVRAAGKGEVRFAGWASGYGFAVVIDHGSGVMTLYGHASRLLVKEGDQVHAGQEILLVGSTGLSTGPHLHFEVRVDDKAVDPLKLKKGGT